MPLKHRFSYIFALHIGQSEWNISDDRLKEILI